MIFVLLVVSFAWLYLRNKNTHVYTTLVFIGLITSYIIAVLASCFGFALAAGSKWNEKNLQALFSILVLAELVCLSLHAYALVMPSLAITYRLSG